MRPFMKTLTHLLYITLLSILLTACSGGGSGTDTTTKIAHGMEAEPEPEKGPHRGRLLKDGDFNVFKTKTKSL